MSTPKPKPPAIALCVEALEQERKNSHNSPDARQMEDSEAPPDIDFYSQTIEKKDPTKRRPTINELTEGKTHRQSSVFPFNPPTVNNGPRKFGWIEGVFIRCLQNIFGVILFLRLTWVTAQAGVLFGISIILLSSVVTIITAISTSAIATNGQIKGGGLYYLISRTLGPEFGGSIGIIFSIANCVGGALHLVGLAETAQDQLANYGISIIDGGINDVRVIGCITCTLVMAVIVISISLESKIQQLMTIPLVASVGAYYIGTFVPNQSKADIGYTGYSISTLAGNLLPEFRDGHSFFTVFAVFFPAATGIMAGANISGDLKNPQQAIPRGTISAICVSSAVYISVIVMSGLTVLRDASGADPLLGVPPCAANYTCEFGLANYYQVVATTSLWPPIAVFGIFALTLSSALASLVSASKVFQAVCKDNLIPLIGYFGKGYGNSNEPRRAYALVYVVVMCIVAIGELNVIAPVISNFFLGSYALVNYSCFNASFSQTPGFRPAFPFYNMWVSLLGSVLCIVIMFIMTWSTALITFFFFAIIYMFIKRIKPDVNWGASLDANIYKNTLQGIIKLTKNEEHVKNYRPQVLVMSGEPWERASLVLMGSSITRGTSLLLCGNVIIKDDADLSNQLTTARATDLSSQGALRRVGVKGVCKTIVAESLEAGCSTLCQTSGLGKLVPNIILFGFMAHEVTERDKVSIKTRTAYLHMIMSAFKTQMGVAIYRSRNKIVLDNGANRRTFTGENDKKKSISKKRVSDSTHTHSLWHRPLGRGCIDVWWLSDDGGLTLLIPYLLTLPKSHLEGSRLRVFTVSSNENLAQESAKMIELLKLFRIPYRDMHVLPMESKPKKDTILEFETFTAPFVGTEPGMITKKELEHMKPQIYRQLIWREMLLTHSKTADLIVITLPFPPTGISGPLYTSWLEMMTRHLPSTLLVRGNQQSVLTFYS